MRNHLLSFLLLLVIVVWGYTFSVVKEASAAYGVASFLAVRFSIAFFCLLPLGWRQMNKKTLLVGGGIGIVLAAAYFFQTLGLCYTTSTNSGLITSLLVIAAPLFNRMLFGVRTRPLLWLAVGLTTLGMVLLTGYGTKEKLAGFALGDLLTLGAALGFGLQIVFLDRYSKHHDTFALTLAQTAATALAFLAIWPLVAPIAWPSGEVWKALLLTGVVATAGGFYIQTLAQRELPAARVVVIVSLEALFAMFFGYLLAGDRLSAVQLLGAGLMLAAVVLAEIVPVLLPKE
jgi:drug/metabolite transporter (DMT)-like permease